MAQKIALVTGASGVIGQAITQAVAHRSVLVVADAGSFKSVLKKIV